MRVTYHRAGGAGARRDGGRHIARSREHPEPALTAPPAPRADPEAWHRRWNTAPAAGAQAVHRASIRRCPERFEDPRERLVVLAAARYDVGRLRRLVDVARAGEV